jgi:hypothetical protein
MRTTSDTINDAYAEHRNPTEYKQTVKLLYSSQQSYIQTVYTQETQQVGTNIQNLCDSRVYYMKYDHIW